MSNRIRCSAGIDNEFLFSGRLDNLAMSYCSLAALIDCYPTEQQLADESTIKAIALFDHEEVGSASAQGMFTLLSPDVSTQKLLHLQSSWVA